jgi:hypothetical protein
MSRDALLGRVIPEATTATSLSLRTSLSSFNKHLVSTYPEPGARKTGERQGECSGGAQQLEIFNKGRNSGYLEHKS